jgi:hypothetical protein
MPSIAENGHPTPREARLVNFDQLPCPLSLNTDKRQVSVDEQIKLEPKVTTPAILVSNQCRGSLAARPKGAFFQHQFSPK